MDGRDGRGGADDARNDLGPHLRHRPVVTFVVRVVDVADGTCVPSVFPPVIIHVLIYIVRREPHPSFHIRWKQTQCGTTAVCASIDSAQARGDVMMSHQMSVERQSLFPPEREFRMRQDISRTFDKSDGLFQPVSVLVAVVEDVGADGEAGRLFQQRIDFIDGVEHRLQGLDDAKRERTTHI